MILRRIAAICIAAALTLSATSLLAQGNKYPSPTGSVNDFANVIDDGMQAKMEALQNAFHQQTGIAVVVATLPSLDGVPIDDLGTRLYEEWGIGKKGEDKGLLILVAPNERKARIETGYGVEGAINDAMAGKIIDNEMLPYFKKGDYTSGIASAVAASIAILNDRLQLGFDASTVTTSLPRARLHKKKGSVLGNILKVIGIIFLIFLFIKHPGLALFFLMGMGGRGGGSSSGGFGGGGFGGFGGGLSGGGGASRSW